MWDHQKYENDTKSMWSQSSNSSDNNLNSSKSFSLGRSRSVFAENKYSWSAYGLGICNSVTNGRSRSGTGFI